MLCRSMSSPIWIHLLGFLFMASGIMSAPPKRPIAVPFERNYVLTWCYNKGFEIELYLDKYTGTGFQSKGSYLFRHFNMQIKLVPGDYAGTILSSQILEHDEIDFKFLGNRTSQPYILQTNVFTGGKDDREQKIYLWFDPTKAYHSYSMLWNSYQIALSVELPNLSHLPLKELRLLLNENQEVGDDAVSQEILGVLEKVFKVVVERNNMEEETKRLECKRKENNKVRRSRESASTGPNSRPLKWAR
ncbi:hypothetical protein CXB51_031503 [Gossypium anomalum]|uniref:GH16 domain-containing protein n=1 Tax=Gossypium anomalum TaxID=47600 RepID=A0A8J5XTC8_9ROSI|nr:hypothetical protein CXB51_031503 [Gossypium anomalum]